MEKGTITIITNGVLSVIKSDSKTTEIENSKSLFQILRMCSLTMDIIQWLLLDEKLVRNWRSFAWRLGLSEYIVSIECWRGEKERRRRGWRDKDKLEMLLRMWKEKKPETYHTDMLKTALAEEVRTIFF